MSKETFKSFVRVHPELADYVLKNSISWQQLYEIYELYGDNSSVWNKYFTKEKVVDSITKAIELNQENPPKELELVESDLILESNLQEYGQIQDDSNWANIIYNALIKLRNEAKLEDIYREVKKIIEEKYPEKSKNKEIEATIRGMLQRYSSDSKHFNGQTDLFTNIKKKDD